MCVCVWNVENSWALDVSAAAYILNIGPVVLFLSVLFVQSIAYVKVLALSFFLKMFMH